MAFNPGGTDYSGFQRTRDRADEGLTRAMERKAMADKQARIKKSGERSGLQKLASTVARGAAAYYTGGMSEQMGAGDMIDEAALGTDSQGNAVKNEYGGLVKAGSGIYQGMKARKASDVAKKRASNLSDYKEQVGLAKEMGVLDKKQGRDMLLDAQELRGVQQAQTQAGEDASLWGWDNKFDDLGKTPAQIKGQQIAQERQALGLSSEARRQGGQLDGRKAAEDQLRSRIREASPIDQGRSGEELDKGVRDQRVERQLNKQKALEEARTSAREDASRRGYKTDAAVDRTLDEAEKGMSVGKVDEDRMWKRLSNEDDIDREYDKRLVSGFGREATGKTKDEYVADYLGGGQKNRQGNYADDWMTGRDRFKGSPMSKSYLEEKPKEDDYRSAMDKMADEGDRRKNVQKAQDSWFPSKVQKQLILEDRLEREEALKREHARTGGPMGRPDYEGSMYAPIKSALRKRMEARRQKANEVAIQKGGVLAGSTAQ